MTRALAGRAGVVLTALVVLWSWDAIVLKHTRAWAGSLPIGLVGLFGVLLAMRAAARRAPDGGTSWLARRLGRLDGHGLAALALALGLVALFHLGFERAAGDGRAYFAQLHSLVFDRDLDYANEARDFGAGMPGIFPIGSMLLWLPFYLAAHAWLGLLSLVGADVRLDGYGPPYQMAVGLGTVAYGIAGLALAYRVARDWFTPGVALGATVAVCAGSFLIWYLTIDASWTHGTSMFAVTLFLYAWHRSRADRSVHHWALLGAAAGLMTLVRWQNAMFVLVPAVEMVVLAVRALARGDRDRMSRLGLGGLAAAAAGLLVFLPQMYVWKVLNGGWLSAPHGQAGQMWWGDSLVADVLFSSNHGLFAWHPLLYVATLGLLLFARRDWRLAALLVACFAVQAYLNGAVSTWWGGSAFGGRRFDGLTLAFVLGLASVIDAGMRRPALVLGTAAAAFIGANALLIDGVTRGELPVGEGLPADRMATAAYPRLGNPFSFPASAWFAWRHGGTPADYDRVGRQLFSNVRVDMGEPGDEMFLIFGWSGRESDAEGSFRWSDGPASGLSMSLLGTRVLRPDQTPGMLDHRLSFRAAPFGVTGRGPQSIAAVVNGREVGRVELSDGYADYEFRVPGHVLGRGLNHIELRYGYALSPRDAGIGDDGRVLAVRFDTLVFEQVTGG